MHALLNGGTLGGHFMTILGTREVVPDFDFTEPLALSLADRLSKITLRAEAQLSASGYQELTEAPCIPPGATNTEIAQLTEALQIALPDEYVEFLRRHRYLLLGDGLQMGGLDHDGVHYVSPPWISHEHLAGHRFLVLCDYWKYADGDQLLVDLDDPQQPVLAYLHAHGPLFERFAPSISLAVWRLVHEEDEDEDEDEDSTS